jgi:hypothetical protein
MVGFVFGEAGGSLGGCALCSLGKGSSGSPSQEKERGEGEKACAQHCYDSGDHKVLR